MIFANETLKEIIERWPATRAILIENGFPDFAEDEAVNQVGSFVRLSTLAKTRPEQVAGLMELLNAVIANEPHPLATREFRDDDLTMVGMLPCGLKMPIKRAIDGFASEQAANTKLILEGNLYHDVSYYEYIEQIDAVDELPELILSSDINSFYHEKFRSRFLEKGTFEKLTMPHNELFERSGLIDPQGEFAVIAANALVIVADHTKLGERPVPESWEDLLNPIYKNDITLRGDSTFFCSAVLVPFMQMWGEEGLKKLANNTRSGKHPREMVKLAGTAECEASAICVMPLLFAHRIKAQQNITIVYPKEGPFASLVTLFVKKNAGTEAAKLKEYLFSSELGAVAAKAYHFPATPLAEQTVPFDKLYWIGWDYIREMDLGARKRQASELFYKWYRS